MKKTNNKRYYVFPQLPFFIFVLSIFEIVATVLCLTLPNEAGQENLSLFIISFVVVISIVQSAMVICVMWAKIGIDESGVTKYILGKKIKHFSWESIQEIKGLDKNAVWLVFCNRHVPDEKLVFCNRKSYTIPVYKREEIVSLVKKYYPVNAEKKIKITDFVDLSQWGKILDSGNSKILIKSNSDKLSIEANKEGILCLAKYLVDYAVNESEEIPDKLQLPSNNKYFERDLSEDSKEYVIKEIDVVLE